MKKAIFVSGSGTIFKAMLETELRFDLAVADNNEPTCKMFDIASADAKGKGYTPTTLQQLQRGRAKRVGNDWECNEERVKYSINLAEILNNFGIELVVMAGWMTVLSEEFFTIFEGWVINTHPALLPSFAGAHGVRDALRYGVKVVGSTQHIATAKVDHGPILMQEAVNVPPRGDLEFDKWVEVTQELIKVVERRNYPELVRLIEAGEIDLDKEMEKWQKNQS